MSNHQDDNILRSSAEWASAHDEVKVIGTLSAGQHWRRILVSTYYAVYHATTAVLWTLGVEARSHEGAQSMLALHVVRPKLLYSEASREFNMLMADRHLADYNSLTEVTQGQALESVRMAKNLLSGLSQVYSAELQKSGSKICIEDLGEKLLSAEVILGQLSSPKCKH
jgi:uncharacterized protein (UPF0332 family)